MLKREFARSAFVQERNPRSSRSDCSELCICSAQRKRDMIHKWCQAPSGLSLEGCAICTVFVEHTASCHMEYVNRNGYGEREGFFLTHIIAIQGHDLVRRGVVGSRKSSV